MSVEIVEKFSDYSGIAKIGSGYDVPMEFNRQHLIDLLQKDPSDQVKLTFAPHNDGKILMVRKPDADHPLWYVLCPLVKEIGEDQL